MTYKEKKTEKQKKIQSYENRYRFWNDKRISQLSFLNNFMLGIGMALIAYIWTQEINFHIASSTDSISWKGTFLFITLFLSFISTLSGFILAISRLYDLRLTSNILLTRKRALKKNIPLYNVKKNNKKKSFLYSLKICWYSIKILLSVIYNYENYEINANDINNKKFKKIKRASNIIGNFTWSLFNFQISTLAISIISLFCSVLR